MNAKLRDYQEAGVADIRARFAAGDRSVLYVLPTGGGKCLGKGTPVLMANGTIRPVEEIGVGESVMGPDGRPRRVVSLARGREEMFRVTPTKGDAWTCNRSHILSLKLTPDHPEVLHDVVNISVDEYLRRSATFKHRAKLWRTGVEMPGRNIPQEMPPYLLGLWLGDGSSIYPAFATKDPEVVDELRDYASNFGLHVRSELVDGKCPMYHLTTHQRPRGRGHRTNPFSAALHALGLIGNKHIPYVYKVGVERHRRELLAGLLDSDGHLHHGGYDFISKSEVLADDICYVARSLGLAAYKRPTKKTCTNTGASGQYYRVSISGDCSIIPCRIDRKRAPLRQQIKDVTVTGFRVESIGEGDYYGFTLEGPDRLFLLGDFTVTHNTMTFAYVTAGTAQKGKRVLLLAHRRELLRQISKALQIWGVSHAVMAGGSMGIPRSPVVVASVFTLANRISRFAPPDLIIGDEAHHFTPRSTWGKVVAAFPKARVLGVSATPERLDGKGLGDIFQSMVLGPSVAELTMRGFLSPAEVYAPAMPDLSGVKRGANDYQREDLEAAMDKPSITGSAVGHYTKLCPGKKAVAFCVSVKHADDVAAEFRAAGYNAASIDGAMDDGTRDRVLRSFEAGDIDVLTSCDLISEGFDLPAIEVAILLRPTESLSLYLQQVGRAIRPAPGKTKTIVLDHAGNTRRHGFIDEERDWKLTGRTKRARAGESVAATVRTCPKCFAAHRPMPACPACGHVYASHERKVEQRDGELIMVASADEMAAAVAEADAKQQFHQLVSVARGRGYTDPERWAFNVICSKEAQRLSLKRDAFGHRLINGLTEAERRDVWARTVGTGEPPSLQQ